MSDRGTGGGRDPDKDGGGIEVSLDEDKEPLEGPRALGASLIFQCEQVKREGENPRGKVMKC
jgi:hypothetical protein